jgi:catechol 2,3-dioxygenase-like lactoylglutathione lyase family enzyme
VFQNLDSIILYVSDVERSIRWYGDVLGLDLAAQHGHFAVFQLGSIRISLHVAELDSNVTRTETSMPVFLIDRYQSAKENLEQRGINFVYENEIPNARFGTFHDPDGNPLQIIERF